MATKLILATAGSLAAPPSSVTINVTVRGSSVGLYNLYMYNVNKQECFVVSV